MPLFLLVNNKLRSNFTEIIYIKKLRKMENIFLLSMPGGSEWIIIVVAVLVMFGGRKIPEFMRGLGKGMREFNDAKNNVRDEIEAGMKEEQKK
jgi:sec-independent protein translocase protein TatA